MTILYVNEKANECIAYEIYENQGQDGVFKACHNGILKFDFWKYCNPCEIESPIYDNCCLVCGTINKES
jgi:hypothetical protein